MQPGYCRVDFTAIDRMAADDKGLVHGGYVFGLADYAAMLAVNHPHVVLGAADVKFLKPVAINDQLTAEARVESVAGIKHQVMVSVTRDTLTVMEGVFTCFVLDQHVLG